MLSFLPFDWFFLEISLTQLPYWPLSNQPLRTKTTFKFLSKGPVKKRPVKKMPVKKGRLNKDQ